MPSLRSVFNYLLITGLLMLAGVPIARAQSTGTLQGTVSDKTGAVVTGAQVVATQVQTGTARSVVTDSAGNYSIPALQPGTYRLQITAPGMQPTTLENIVLSVDSTERVNATLGLAAASQTVTVSGAVQQMNSSTMTVGQVIGSRTVQQIPLNGRHFLDLGELIPGSVTAPQNGFLTAPLQGLGAESFDTAGNREDTVNFMINGINLNDMVQNQITFQPTIATVSEFKVDNSSLSAEYGRNSGAVVNVATRSGTNEFHGEAFDYIRNNDVDARNYFNPHPIPMSTFKRNNPGADLGGPVWIPRIYDGRNKTFFFVSYEGLLQSQGLTINSGVPTNAERSQTTDPIIQKLLTLVPQANDATGTRYLGSASSPVTVEQFTGDLLHNLGSNDQLHLYYACARIEVVIFVVDVIVARRTHPDEGDRRGVKSDKAIFAFRWRSIPIEPESKLHGQPGIQSIDILTVHAEGIHKDPAYNILWRDSKLCRLIRQEAGSCRKEKRAGVLVKVVIDKAAILTAKVKRIIAAQPVDVVGQNQGSVEAALRFTGRAAKIQRNVADRNLRQSNARKNAIVDSITRRVCDKVWIEADGNAVEAQPRLIDNV